MNTDVVVIVSDKKHFKNFETFAYTLGLAVFKEGEIPFKENNDKHWEKGFVDVLFGPTGTLICAPVRDYNVAAASQTSQVALLSLSLNPMAFNLECAENGSMKRIYTDVNGIIRRNTQNPLDWESKEKNYQKILANCVRAFTGKELSEYNNDMAIRYEIIR